MGVSDGDHPFLEYPMPYTFKVVGRRTGGFPEFVRRLVSRALGRILPQERIRKVRESEHGTYASVTLDVVLVAEAERQAVYQALWASDRVLFYL